MSTNGAFIPIKFYLPGWPADIIDYPDQLDTVGLNDINVGVMTPSRIVMDGSVQMLTDVAFDLPLITGTSIVLLNDGGLTQFAFHFDFKEGEFTVLLTGLSAAIRYQTDLLKRMELVGDNFVEAPADPVTGEPQPVEISINGADL